jgi:hypothetical protein
MSLLIAVVSFNWVDVVAPALPPPGTIPPRVLECAQDIMNCDDGSGWSLNRKMLLLTFLAGGGGLVVWDLVKDGHSLVRDFFNWITGRRTSQ